MLDAEAFLRFAARLRTVHERVSGVQARPEQVARWQRRLVAITRVADGDLGRAEGQLAHLEAELDRATG